MLRLRASGVAIAALCLLASAVQADAQERLITLQKKVSFRDLNLANDNDVETLRQRIDQAVNELCKPDPSSRQTADDQCSAKAKTGALVQMEAAVRRFRPSYVASMDD